MGIQDREIKWKEEENNGTEGRERDGTQGVNRALRILTDIPCTAITSVKERKIEHAWSKHHLRLNLHSAN